MRSLMDGYSVTCFYEEGCKMAHSHYVLDLYYSGDRDTDVLRRDVMRIEARDDAEAIQEGIRVSGWRHPGSLRYSRHRQHGACGQPTGAHGNHGACTSAGGRVCR
jgi:hypothetical protein